MDPAPTAPTSAEAETEKKLAIVPAYDEGEAISGVVAAVTQWAPDYDVLVLDDGSSDDTARAAAAAGAKVLRMPFNLGIGGAMQAGYEYARGRGYTIAVQVDGDGQHLAHLGELEQRLGEEPGVDMVTGSRFLDCEGGGFRSSLARRCGIRLFAGIVTLITKQKVTDPTSGFRMTNRRAIELLRPKLPPRVPRDRGYPPRPRPRAAQLRGSRGDAGARDREVHDLLPALRLLRLQGAPRDHRERFPGETHRRQRRRDRERQEGARMILGDLLMCF